MEKFTYRVLLWATLERTEADLVLSHMKLHQDTICFTLVGEFAFSFSNFYKGVEIERNWSFKEVDIMLKALELPLEKSTSEIDVLEKRKTINKLVRWSNLINKEVLRVNRL